MGELKPECLTKSQKGGTTFNELDKRKVCGKFKERTCTDGIPQICCIPKWATSSPTTSLEALFFSLIFDAQKGRDRAILMSLWHALTLKFQERN